MGKVLPKPLDWKALALISLPLEDIDAYEFIGSEGTTFYSFPLLLWSHPN